jgi:hypothetical protein
VAVSLVDGSNGGNAIGALRSHTNAPESSWRVSVGSAQTAPGGSLEGVALVATRQLEALYHGVSGRVLRPKSQRGRFNLLR